MDAASVIQKINREYAAFLLKPLSRIEAVTIPAESLGSKPWETFGRLMESRSGLLIYSGMRGMTPVQYTVDAVCRDIKTFWDAAGAEYRQAVQELPGLSVVADTAEDAAVLSLYFDTVVIPDDAMSLPFVNPDVEYATYGAISELRKLFALLPLLQAESDAPLVALLPEWEPGTYTDKSRKARVGESTIPGWKMAEQNALGFLDSIAVRPLSTADILDWYRLARTMKGTTDIRNILDADRIRQFFGPVPRWPEEPKSAFLAVMRSESHDVDAPTLESLIKAIHDMFLTLAHSDAIAALIHGDPLVRNTSSYAIKCEIEARRTVAAARASEETVAASVISSPPFTWLRGLTVDEILTFRNADGLSYLRSTFRDERRRIKEAAVGDFESIGREVHDSLDRAIREFESELALDRAIGRRKLRRQVLEASIAAAVSFVSIAVPPLAMLSIPAALWSATVGTTSLREIINERVQRRRHLELLGARPLGILAKARRPGNQMQQ